MHARSNPRLHACRFSIGAPRLYTQYGHGAQCIEEVADGPFLQTAVPQQQGQLCSSLGRQ